MNRIVIIGLVFFGALGWRAAQAAPVSLRLAADQTEYTVGQAIDLTLTVKNLTDQPLRVVNPAYPGVSRLRVVNAESLVVQPRVLDQAPPAMDQIWQLAPGEERVVHYPNLRCYTADQTWDFGGTAQLGQSIYKILLTVDPAALAGALPGDVFAQRLVANLLEIKVFAPGRQTLTCPTCGAK